MSYNLQHMRACKRGRRSHQQRRWPATPANGEATLGFCGGERGSPVCNL